MPSSIENTVLENYQETFKDKNHCYKSWEHCFDYFEDIIDHDKACLHLAFYLASWGMYRGSGFLLQKDYKIFEPIVDIILSYKHLRDFSLKADEQPAIRDIFNLKKELMIAIPAAVGEARNPSDTLITKIMLGTLGCVPAYDRYVVGGLGRCGLKHKSFREKSLLEIIAFGRRETNEIQEIKKTIKQNGIEYTDMKILDMYFWEIGAME